MQEFSGLERKVSSEIMVTVNKSSTVKFSHVVVIGLLLILLCSNSEDYVRVESSSLKCLLFRTKTSTGFRITVGTISKRVQYSILLFE